MMLRDLMWKKRFPVPHRLGSLSEEEGLILSVLDDEPRSIDWICDRIGVEDVRERIVINMILFNKLYHDVGMVDPVEQDEMRDVIEMVRGWRSENRGQRFTQWIQNLVGNRDPYNVEDEELATLMEGYFARGRRFEHEVDEKPQDPSS